MAIANYSSRIAAVCWIFLVLTWTFVCMRCYTRIFLVKNFGLDDYLAVVSLILFSLFCAFFLIDSHWGLGQHTINIPLENFPNVMMYWVFAAMTWCWTTMAYKASICVFLARFVFEPVQLAILWTVLAVNTFGCLALFLIFLLQCHPVDFFWNQYKGPPYTGHCLSQELVANLALGQASIMLVVDITIVVLPIYMVWNMTMTPWTKVGVAFILSLGAVASIATIIRFPYIAIIHKHALDFPYVTVNHTIWSLVEPGIGIMAAAMATLRPLFLNFLARSTLWSPNEKSPKSSSGEAQHVETVGRRRNVIHSFRHWGATDVLRTDGDMEDGSVRDVGNLKGDEIGVTRKGSESATKHSGSEGTLGEELTETVSGNHLIDYKGDWIVERRPSVVNT